MFTLIKPLNEEDENYCRSDLSVFHLAVDNKGQKYICTWFDWVKQEDIWLFIPIKGEFENQENISLFKMWRLANKIFKSTLEGKQYKEVLDNVRSFWEKDILINLK